MCSAPSIPANPQRQQVQLPDGGAPVGNHDPNLWRRVMMAGMATSPTGVLGNSSVGKQTLG